MKKLTSIALGLIVAQMTTLALAQSGGEVPVSEAPRLQWQISPYTYHFSYNEEHENVYMVGLEREHADGKLDGGVLFSNSFGQPSIYLYPWGHVYKGIFGQPKLSFKWTAGLLYGYVEPYENKVPFNHNGFSPGIVLALAYEFRPDWAIQLDVLGNSGLMIQLNMPFKNWH
ncbi:MAG TPA: hypothetical protein VLR44_09790 [Rhodoferax sp.]|nr:hypothetical protein [Rhodoferax sp.]